MTLARSFSSSHHRELDMHPAKPNVSGWVYARLSDANPPSDQPPTPVSAGPVLVRKWESMYGFRRFARNS